MKQNMFLIKEKPHNVVEKPTHRAGNKMWENWMEKEMEIFPNFILEKKQKSTIFEFMINPKNGQPILEHDTTTIQTFNKKTKVIIIIQYDKQFF